ncbi:MAG: acyl-CoA dehydrogenase [Gammaproteobacteria bacterium]
MIALLWWLVFVFALLALAYVHASRAAWTGVLLAVLLVYSELSPAAGWIKAFVWFAFAAPLVVVWAPTLRRRLFSDRLYAFYRASMPDLSRTEREALEAGSTWWDAELFSGNPQWRTLLDSPTRALSEAERAFLEGPTEQLCAMLDDWRDNHVRHDIPPQAWSFVKEQGFFGMVIPPEYGGKGFSQTGHASVIMKLATRSISGALTVMIPNSVGPGKLLLKYGTDEQKRYWLPRLAAGDEIPCFALTGPEAGSDAGAIPDTGIVCERDGVLGVRLDFDKRYITLGPVATVLGLAFKLIDPDGLLDTGRSELGITLALVPVSTPGVETGRRHNPMHMSFMNGPVRGHDVFVPLDALIGGVEYAGQGWRMLIECLTDGRSISLPALSTAAAKVSARATGAYARIRSQFRTPIGYFEGVQEALARIAGNTYAMDAARRVTLAALDDGKKPPVISAIMKYNMTERARQVIADALDVHGGAGVCLGPRNVVGLLHQFPPVAVTVEGANILTRSMMTFGQGAIRCHPYLLAELNAANDTDRGRGAATFDRAVTSHIGLSMSNGVRTVLLGLTGGALARAPRAGPVARYYRQLTRLSAAFSVTADLLLLTLRGELKRRERLSARMADIVSQLYIASAALKHFDASGAPAGDLPLVAWACEDALHRAERAFTELFDNMEPPWLAAVLRWFVFPWGLDFRRPSDGLDHEIARILLAPSSTRDRLTAGLYLPRSTREHLGRLEDALNQLCQTEAARRTLADAVKMKVASGRTLAEQVESAVTAGAITADDAARLQDADLARREALAVDDFESL